ncbi:hypothetical protein IQ07DRAFT_258177 [Pyrenochaeta sp. DS3sAY3a]|nr:hypothetical protein IQ07DRAFT_258177 [Pyrenochaeta sp. DS3sAY3a]
MAATTRARTGNSKPRIVQQIEAAVAPKKRTTTTTKANTSKPRTSKVATGRVAKPKAATTTTTKRTTKTTGANVKTVKKPRTTTEKVVDKVVGKAEKIVGDVEGKPGKKVCRWLRFVLCLCCASSGRGALLVLSREAYAYRVEERTHFTSPTNTSPPQKEPQLISPCTGCRHRKGPRH